MASHFFTNRENKQLLEKFEGIFENFTNLYAFHAVVGYFRASGYHAIREKVLELGDVKILVGINVDHMIAEAKRRGLMFLGDPKRTRQEFVKWMQEDIKEASNSKVCSMRRAPILCMILLSSIYPLIENSQKFELQFLQLRMIYY